MTQSQQQAELETIRSLGQTVGLELTDDEMTALAKPLQDLIAAVEAATRDWEMTSTEPNTPVPGSSEDPA